MSNEWDTSKSGTILLKAACLLALSIHRLSATTSRIFLVGPPLFVTLPSIGRLVILNAGDKREKKREGGSLVELEWESDEEQEQEEEGRKRGRVRVRDGRTGAVRRRYRRDDRRTNY